MVVRARLRPIIHRLMVGRLVSIFSCLRKMEELGARGVYMTLCEASPSTEESAIHSISNNITDSEMVVANEQSIFQMLFLPPIFSDKRNSRRELVTSLYFLLIQVDRP
jgi:hypothetical protein